jgi:hypothetical protein
MCQQVTAQGSEEGKPNAAAAPESSTPDLVAEGAEGEGSENALSMLSAYGSQQAGSPRSAAVATDARGPPISPQGHSSDSEPATASLAAEEPDLAAASEVIDLDGHAVITSEVAGLVAAAAIPSAGEQATAKAVSAAVTDTDSAPAPVEALATGEWIQRGEEGVASETAPEPEQAAERQKGTPPEDMQAIMAKLVAFVKVRPGPMHPAVRQKWTRLIRPLGLRSCG